MRTIALKDAITPTQAAEMIGVARSRILTLLGQGRIERAVQLENGQWLLPRNFKVAAAPNSRKTLEKLPKARVPKV